MPHGRLMARVGRIRLMGKLMFYELQMVNPAPMRWLTCSIAVGFRAPLLGPFAQSDIQYDTKFFEVCSMSIQCNFLATLILYILVWHRNFNGCPRRKSRRLLIPRVSGFAPKIFLNCFSTYLCDHCIKIGINPHGLCGPR
jgi:hypothetical protein